MPTPTFKRIGLFGRPNHARTAKTVQSLRSHLDGNGIELFPAENTCFNPFDTDFPARAHALAGQLDLGIAVGGDGTMLHLARNFAATGVPLIGVNLGRLGFLTDMSADLMHDEMDEILSGQYYTERRLLLDAQIVTDGQVRASGIALNDVVISKGSTGRMIEYSWVVGDELVGSAHGDGVIVATPTGSTAYALSAGGPILHPTLPAISVVPICPHAMGHRPIVLESSSVITITIDDLAGADGHVFLDGMLTTPLAEGDQVRINKFEGDSVIIRASSHTHFEALRSKLGWAS